MARAGFQTARCRAGQRLGLKARHDGAAFNDFAGEQVGRAHEHADLDATLDQRRGQRGDHGRGMRVVDAAGEIHVHITGVFAAHLGQQHLDHLLPQREAGNRADMPTALPPFKHEAPRALLQIELEQGRCRRMQIGRDATLLELGSLVRTTSGNQRIAGLVPKHRSTLLFAQCLRHEAENPNTPGLVAKHR